MLSRVAWVAILLAGCQNDYDLQGDPTPNDPDDDDVEDPGDDPDDEIPAGSGGITGRICSPSENAYVSGADVWVDLDGEIIATTTDADGWFTLEGLPAGEHTVYVQKGSFSTEFTVDVEEDRVTELAQEECLSSDDVTIAVVTGQYDSIQVVLDHLGFDYDLINGLPGSSSHTNLLLDPSALEQYDIIFFNCGMDDGWTAHENTIANNLRDYVANGGSVYTSDWAYYLAEVTYPNMADFVGDDTWQGSAYVGDAQYVNATVLDPDMIAVLGTNSAEINYDLAIWASMESAGTGTTLIRGSYTYGSYYGWYGYYGGTTVNGPLAVRQEDGDGSLIYTSFHNERQTTLDMDLLLQEIILSL